MIFKIPIEIYKTECYVYLDETDEAAKKHYATKVGKNDPLVDALEIPDGTEARAILHRSRLSFVRFRSNPTVDNVAHELLHVTMHTLRECGVKAGWKSEEAATYLLAYLVKQFYKKSKEGLNL